MIIGATNSSVDITKGKLSFGGEFINNITNLFKSVDVMAGVLISLKVAFLGTILTLIICSMAGYGFEIFKTKTSEK